MRARTVLGWTAGLIRAKPEAQASRRGQVRLASWFVAGTVLSALTLLPATTSAQGLVVVIFGGSFADNTQECAVFAEQNAAKLRAAGVIPVGKTTTRPSSATSP
jgi:hypothetical protein